MIGFYNYTVILTYLSLAFAMVGIHLSFNGLYQWAFICLIMCGICDTFDGMVARSKKDRTEEEKRFGIQIDSLCDLISFGVFPAILGYNVGLSSVGWLIIEICYVLAAVIRLAYFNVTEEMVNIKVKSIISDEEKYNYIKNNFKSKEIQYKSVSA